MLATQLQSRGIELLCSGLLAEMAKAALFLQGVCALNLERR